MAHRLAELAKHYETIATPSDDENRVWKEIQDNLNGIVALQTANSRIIYSEVTPMNIALLRTNTISISEKTELLLGQIDSLEKRLKNQRFNLETFLYATIHTQIEFNEAKTSIFDNVTNVPLPNAMPTDTSNDKLVHYSLL